MCVLFQLLLFSWSLCCLCYSDRCNQFFFDHFLCDLRMFSSLLPSFIDTYSLSTSSLGCKALRIVMKFLVLNSICWSLPASTLRMSPSNLRGGRPSFLSLWWDFFYVVWLWVVFSFSWSILFFNSFNDLRLFDGVRFQYSKVFVNFLFFERSDFSWFGSSIPFVVCRFFCFCSSLLACHIF